MAKLRSQRRYSHTLGKRSYKPNNSRAFPTKKVSALLFATLIFGGIFYFLFFSGHFGIKNIEIEGAKTIPNQEVAFAVELVLSRKKLGLVPLRNIILLPSDKLEASLMESFPKIRYIELAKNIPDSLVIKISEREALGIWCGESCFYFDKEGIAFEPSSKSVGSLILSVMDGRKGERDLGEKVLDEYEINLFSAAKELIENNFLFAVKNFAVEDTGEISILTSGGWRILLDKNATPEFQLSNLKYILDEEIGPRLNELEYVDLRLGNRVYYRYK